MDSSVVSERSITWTISLPLECFMCTEENIDNVILYPCQHISCRECNLKIMTNNNSNRKCPECREKILSVVDFFSNSAYGPKTSCPYAECEKHGVEYSLVDLRKHINGECEYGFIKCSCGISIKKMHHKKLPPGLVLGSIWAPCGIPKCSQNSKMAFRDAFKKLSKKNASAPQPLSAQTNASQAFWDPVRPSICHSND